MTSSRALPRRVVLAGNLYRSGRFWQRPVSSGLDRSKVAHAGIPNEATSR